MTEEPRTQQQQLDDLIEANPHLERTEPSIAWVLKVVVISMIVAAVIPTAAFFYLDSKSSDQRIRQNRNLIERVETDRIAVQERINDFIFEQCVQAEARDVVYAQWGGALLRIARRLDQTDADIRLLIDTLEDGITVLEPEDEKDCTPPAATTP